MWGSKVRIEYQLINVHLESQGCMPSLRPRWTAMKHSGKTSGPCPQRDLLEEMLGPKSWLRNLRLKGFKVLDIVCIPIGPKVVPFWDYLIEF